MSEAIGEDERCAVCGEREWSNDVGGKLIPVWEDPADYERGEAPDYIGCTECGTMKPFEAGEDDG